MENGGSPLEEPPGDTVVTNPLPATVPSSGFDCAAAGEIPVAECQALVAFYEATGGANWTDKDGWLETNAPCSWAGVSCAGGHVDALSIHFNNLQGPLPLVLTDLAHLRVLDLHNNAFSGAIPAEYGRLSNLEYIDISANRLNGSIPDTFGELTALQSLNLAHNELSGVIPAEVGSMTALRNLDLSYNQLSGDLPASLADLAALETLRLRDNLLEGEIPFDLGGLPALAEVDLTFNRLSGSVPSALYEVAIHRFWGNLLEGGIFVDGDGQQEVNYLGTAFTLDAAVADSVWPELVAERPAVAGPGVVWAPAEHVVFTLSQGDGPQAHNPLGLYLPSEAQIYIYPVAGLNAEVLPVVQALQQVLDDPATLAAYGVISPQTQTVEPALATLPPSNAVQNFRAQVEKITFTGGSGVRYLTQLSQGPVPVNNQDLFYTFQGLTSDGATYVAAYFPVTLPDLPDSPQIGDEAFGKLMEDWQGYLTQTSALLDGQPTSAYTPDLEMLDALIHSLTVAGSTPALEATWPDDGEAVDPSPILQWEPFDGAADYHVVVLDDEAYPPQVVIDETVAEPVLAVEPPLAPGHYSWTVWAQGGDGSVLAELTSTFSVKDTLALVSPADGAEAGSEPLLAWQSFPGASSYQVIVIDDAYPPLAVLEQTTGDTSLAITPPLKPGNYSWRVLAQDGDAKVLAELNSRFTVGGD